MEVWKDIEGYEGLYQVSNFGRVKRYYLRNGKTRVLKPLKNSSGYLIVGLSKKSVVKTNMVHRLMMNSFNPIKDNLLDVNHKNGIKTDNMLENLEWCTRSENIIHSIKNKLSKTKLTKESIFIIRDMLKTHSHKEIAEKFKVTKHSISRISCGQSWKFV